MASPPPPAPQETNPRAALFVWTVWALLTIGAVGYVWYYSRNIPYWDDWHVTVCALTDLDPVTPAWLWFQMQGSRVPIPKLVLLGVVIPTGLDFRAPSYYTVLAFAAVAFALIRVSKGVRGHIRYTDAFFPLALLHWGHCEMFLWGTLIYLTVPVSLVGTLLVLIVRYRRCLSASAAVLAGLCLALLTLCGNYGLMLVPPLFFWLVCMGFSTWRSGHPRGRRDGLVALGVATATLLVLGLYFVGLDRATGLTAVEPRPLADLLDGAGRVLAMTLGPTGKLFWPIAGVVPAVLLSLTLLFLVLVYWSLPGGELPRYLGLLCFTGMCLLSAGGISWMRSIEGQFTLYYGTLPSLGFLSAYFVWDLYGSRIPRFVAQLGFVTLMAVLFVFNLHEGIRFGQERHDVLAAVEKDVLSQMPVSQIVQRHVRKLLWPEADGYKRQWIYLHAEMMYFQRLQSGPFKHLQPDVAFEEVTLPLTPVMANNMVWDGGVGEIAAADSSIYLALPEPRFVHGFRVKVAYLDGEASVYPLLLLWKIVGKDTFAGESDHPSLVDVPDAPGAHQETVWVHDTIKQIYLQTSNYHSGDPLARPCRIAEIVFLVPPRAGK